MSLKAFHLVFITLSVLLAFGFGVWAIALWRQYGQLSSAAIGVVSLLIAVGLLGYGVWFWRKLRG